MFQTTNQPSDRQESMPQAIFEAIYTSSAAQGGVGSSKIGNIWERLVPVNDGWQSEPTEDRKVVGGSAMSLQL